MKNQNFDDLMASMGVRKLERGEPRKGPSTGAANKPRTKVRKAEKSMTQTSKQSAAPELGNLRKQVEDLKNELALTRTRLEEQAKETFHGAEALLYPKPAFGNQLVEALF